MPEESCFPKYTEALFSSNPHDLISAFLIIKNFEWMAKEGATHLMMPGHLHFPQAMRIEGPEVPRQPQGIGWIYLEGHPMPPHHKEGQS